MGSLKDKLAHPLWENEAGIEPLGTVLAVEPLGAVEDLMMASGLIRPSSAENPLHRFKVLGVGGQVNDAIKSSIKPGDIVLAHKDSAPQNVHGVHFMAVGNLIAVLHKQPPKLEVKS